MTMATILPIILKSFLKKSIEKGGWMIYKTHMSSKCQNKTS
jgi:hypothetical protein